MNPFYELIGNRKANPARVFIQSVDKVQMHWHAEAEIILVLKGSVRVREKNKVYLLKENDVILINGHGIHSLIKTQEDNILLSVQVNVDHIQPYYPDIMNLRYECRSFEAHKDDQEVYDGLRHYLAQLAWHMNKKSESNNLIIAITTYQLADYVFKNFSYYRLEDLESTSDTSDIDRLGKIINYINVNFEKGITLKEIADREDLSLSYLSRFFKEKVGMTFQDYINNIRLDKAISLLYETNKTITDIAYASGFPSGKSFNKLFKDAHGYTPTDFRKKALPNKSAPKSGLDQVEDGQQTKTYLDKDRKKALTKLFDDMRINKDPVPNKLNKPFSKVKIETHIEKKGWPFPHYWKKTFSPVAQGLSHEISYQLIDLQEEKAWAHSRSLIYDTSYVATCIISQVVSWRGEVDGLEEWTLRDQEEEREGGISSFHGGFGLINKDGLKKPSYYAYLFLDKLGDRVIDQGQDYLITKKEDDLQILVYNKAHFDDLFLKGDPSGLTHKERYKIYKDKADKEISLKIAGLSGNYKETCYALNRKHGSVFDKWLEMGAPENMTKEEISYLEGISKAKMKIQYLEIEENYTGRLDVPVHGVGLIILEKQV